MRKALIAAVAVFVPMLVGATFTYADGATAPGSMTLAASDVSTAAGPRSCSATSGDGKVSCSVSCKEDERASCSNTETDATCDCN